MLELIGVDGLTQWDVGRQVKVDKDIDMVHFSNRPYGYSKNVKVTDGVADVPDMFLTSCAPLHIWAYIGNFEKGYTKIEKIYEVKPKNRPEDYIYTPEEVKTWEKLQSEIGDLANLETEAKENLVAAINEVAADMSEGIALDTTLTQSGKAADAKAVGDALAGKQPKGDYLTQDNLQSATDTALAQAKASGEFDGADGKTAYQYAVEGGYTGTETEFAAKLAQEQLTGTTGELTPTQVYDAVSAGIPVKVQYTDSTYGLISFTAFNVSESLNVIVSEIIAYANGVYMLCELWGNKSSNAWGFNITTLAQKTDIPSALPNPNAITFTGAVTGSYDGSAPLSVNIPSGGSGGTDISLGLTSASVGQIIKVKAIDASGKPTAWEAADMPSGGERWRLVRTITLVENVTAIDISEDNDGNPFALKKIRICGNTLGTASNGQLRINVANKTDDSYSILGPYYNFKGLDTTKRWWVAESDCFGIIGDKGKWSEWYNTPDTNRVGAAYARAELRTPLLNSGQYLQDRVEFLHIFSNTIGVEFAAGSYIELWGVDA